MPELPRISGSEAIKVFESLGFSVVRQRGSHVVMRRAERGCVIPIHKQLATGPSGAQSDRPESLLKNL